MSRYHGKTKEDISADILREAYGISKEAAALDRLSVMIRENWGGDTADAFQARLRILIGRLEHMSRSAENISEKMNEPVNNK